MSLIDDGWLTPQNAQELREEIARLKRLLNTPETADFMKGVPLEAAHQIERWGSGHDKEKTPWDWYWTLGYLGGKCARAMLSGHLVKAQHHCVTMAALALNWHRIITEEKNEETGQFITDEELEEFKRHFGQHLDGEPVTKSVMERLLRPPRKEEGVNA